MGIIDNKIENIIHNFTNNNIIVIIVSQETIVNSLEINFMEDFSANYIQYKIIGNNKKFEKTLSQNEINFVINFIKKQMNGYKNRTILIIFNEYFFSNIPILEDERNLLIEKISNSFSKNEIFFLFNFLYKLKNPLTKKEKDDLKEYLNLASTDDQIFNLNLTNGSNNSLIYNEEINNWYTNESILIYNNKAIFTQKKQNFYKEMPLIKENFSLGFGGKETKIKSIEPEIKLYKYFKTFVNIDICLDAQHGFSFKREKYMKNDIRLLSEEDQDIVKKKRKIFNKFNNGEDYYKKHYYIIQSNSTDISDILHHYPENKIIIQADPNSSGIFYTKYSESITKKLRGFIKLKDKYSGMIKEMFEKDKKKINNNNSRQELEYLKALKEMREMFDWKNKDIINRNFYNIIEKINPIKEETEEMENIRINVQLYDLNEFKNSL